MLWMESKESSGGLGVWQRGQVTPFLWVVRLDLAKKVTLSNGFIRPLCICRTLSTFHSFTQQIWIEGMLCTRPVPGTWLTFSHFISQKSRGGRKAPYLPSKSTTQMSHTTHLLTWQEKRKSRVRAVRKGLIVMAFALGFLSTRYSSPYMACMHSFHSHKNPLSGCCFSYPFYRC